LNPDALTTRRGQAPVSRARLLVLTAHLGDAAMNISKMNHAMLSFGLMGGMLVGERAERRRPFWRRWFR
jgi:hypothetical protein